MLELIADRILKHPKVILLDDFELLLQQNEVQTLHQKPDGTVTKKFREECWYSLRIISQNRPSAIFGSDLNDLPHLVDRALQLAKLGTTDPWFRFPILRKPQLAATQEKPTEHSPLAPLASSENRFSFEEKQWNQKNYLRRKGEKREYFFENNFFESKLKLFRSLEDIPFSFWNHTICPSRETFMGAAVFDKLVQKINWVEGIHFQSELPGQIVFSAQAFCSILENITFWLLASNKKFNRSPLPEVTPNAVFSEAITLIDEGNNPKYGQYFPWDAEGNLTKKTKVVEKGTLLTFLYDTYHATQENRLSTSNFFRFPFQEKQSIQTSTFYVEPKEGVCAQSLLSNGYWVDNLFDISYSKGVASLKGIAFPVVDKRWQSQAVLFSLNLNLLELLQRVDAVGNDLEFHGRFGAPSIFIEKMPIS